MKVPNAFKREKKFTEEELEEIVNKTIVEGITVETFAEKVKEALENNYICDNLRFYFERTVEVEGSNLEIKEIKKKESYGDFGLKRDVLRVYFADDYEVLRSETERIISELLDIDPSLDNDSLYHTIKHRFNIITEDMICECTLKILRTYDKYKEKDGELINYCRPYVQGIAKYAKFDKDINNKLMKATEKAGYKGVLRVIEKKEI